MDVKKFNHAIEELFGQQNNSPLKSEMIEPHSSEETHEQHDFSERLDLSFVKLGDNYVNLNNYEYAMECYREALKINPYNTMAFNRLILLPPHLINHLPSSKEQMNLTSPEKLQAMAVNDTFRQTFIGGYIVLSKQVDKLNKKVLFNLLDIIKNLNQEYFAKYPHSLRDYGTIISGNSSYVWMINSYENLQEAPSKNFPVLILMKRQEYQLLKRLIRNES